MEAVWWEVQREGFTLFPPPVSQFEMENVRWRWFSTPGGLQNAAPVSRGSPWLLGATPEVDFKVQQNGQVKELLKRNPV